MRIPYTVPPDAVRAYEPSEPTLGLVAERSRRLRAEVWDWDENALPTLAEQVITFFADNFDDHKNAIPFFNEENLIVFLEVLSTSLALDIAIPYVQDGIYWKRRCDDSWPEACDVSRYNGSWKRTFIEKYIESFLENEEPGYTDWDEVRSTLSICVPYVNRLEITHLQPPRVMESSPIHPDFCSTEYFVPEHLDLSPVLSILVNMEELNLKFGVKEIGMNFRFNYFKVHVKDIEKLGNGIRCLKKLKVLRIACSDIDDKNLNIILKGLEMCEEFYHLEVTHCKITDDGAKALGYFSHIRPSLKCLKLHNNKIGPEGAQGLAYSISFEKGFELDTLDLRFNPIGDEGGKYMATALAKNSHLRTVILAGCGLETEAGVDLAHMLRINKTLLKLDVSNNRLGTEVADLMLDSLEANVTLLRLDVRNCGFTNECMKKVHELTFRNKEKIRKQKDGVDGNESCVRKRRDTPDVRLKLS